LILSSMSETALLKNELFIAADQRGDGGEALENARLGRILGFNTYLAQNVPYANPVNADTVAGTTTSTFTGRTVTVPPNRLDFSGVQYRGFPAFPGVANVTGAYDNTQSVPVTLMAGGGALGQCPGNGCTFSSYTTQTGGATSTVIVQGTAISWCPPAGGEGATPSPGTINNQIGNWNCPSQQGAGTGVANIRFGISNSPGANHYGGTMQMLETGNRDIWNVAVQPGTDGIAEVLRNYVLFTRKPWEGGRENFDAVKTSIQPGPRLEARLNASGIVTQTFGCVNGIGTIGAPPFTPGGPPAAAQGSNCGTGLTPPNATRWGGRLTTGSLEGSDPWPFISMTTQPPASAFAPSAGARTPGQGFFFTRMGGDSVTGTRRNLVLIGGGVSLHPNTGNLAFWLADLRLDLNVPEPATGLGLVAGASALVMLARRRRS
jgi:hypothetical protein